MKATQSQSTSLRRQQRRNNGPSPGAAPKAISYQGALINLQDNYLATSTPPQNAGRLLAGMLLLYFVFGSAAFAVLGETEEQCIRRYGPAEVLVRGGVRSTMHTNVSTKISMVFVVYVHGRAEGIKYIAKDREIRKYIPRLIEMNGRGNPWRPVSDRVWTQDPRMGYPARYAGMLSTASLFVRSDKGQEAYIRYMEPQSEKASNERRESEQSLRLAEDQRHREAAISAEREQQQKVAAARRDAGLVANAFVSQLIDEGVLRSARLVGFQRGLGARLIAIYHCDYISVGGIHNSRQMSLAMDVDGNGHWLILDFSPGGVFGGLPVESDWRRAASAGGGQTPLNRVLRQQGYYDR